MKKLFTAALLAIGFSLFSAPAHAAPSICGHVHRFLISDESDSLSDEDYLALANWYTKNC
jgi:hypothetical protein